jgi:hypothetical protein
LSWKSAAEKKFFRWSEKAKQRKGACHRPEGGAKRKHKKDNVVEQK